MCSFMSPSRRIKIARMLWSFRGDVLFYVALPADNKTGLVDRRLLSRCNASFCSWDRPILCALYVLIEFWYRSLRSRCTFTLYGCTNVLARLGSTYGALAQRNEHAPTDVLLLLPLACCVRLVVVLALSSLLSFFFWGGGLCLQRWSPSLFAVCLVCLFLCFVFGWFACSSLFLSTCFSLWCRRGSARSWRREDSETLRRKSTSRSSSSERKCSKTVWARQQETPTLSNVETPL